MKKKNAFLILIVSVLMVVAALVGRYLKPVANAGAVTQPAFTLQSKATSYNSEGKSIAVADETRYQASNGNYRVVSFRGDKQSEYFFEQGRGQFSVLQAEQRLLRHPEVKPTSALSAPPTAADLKAAPQFVRTEKILGITAYVHSIVNSENGKLMAEVYYTPKTGMAPIKLVMFGENGKPTMVNEPTSIILGEPARALVKGPDYPVVPQP